MELFSGVLPEITISIIQNLRNDFGSLYSCALVNRNLCRITIPILWEDPFFVMYQEGRDRSNFLFIYLLFLNDEDKERLKRLGEICRKSKFLSDIKYFTLDFKQSEIIRILPPNSSYQYLLKYLPSAITTNKHFTIYFGLEGILSEENLENLIQSQTQLLSLTLHYISPQVAYLLSPFKYCSKTLTSIKFNSCDFTNISSLNGLYYLVHLESLQFKLCKGVTVQVFRPLLDIPTPLKIKTLTLEGQNMEINFIRLLFQKVGSFLENLEIYLWEDIERQIVFESIINYCDKIQFLHLYEIDHVDILPFFKLITHVRKNLKYLSLSNKTSDCMSISINMDHLRVCSMILDNLGQILPDSLKYLELKLEIDPTNLKIFLDNCKHIDGLSRLLVINKYNKDIKITFELLKEFVSEKKVMNFAYQVKGLFCRGDQNLEWVANEIQHFKELYYDLIIRISDFDVI
ncbi:14438_t:CDS:2 [Funneliformis caledonium]|uniref:14438_t:CDS:1 n=1 Tax=Funneliformis caledonium TaxID=1117310 RepID=A0A9N9G2C9_9GLOM|nr:14438_t:CDS:2 [Funneliformis caledonium]